MPRAMKAADLSSEMVLQLISGCLEKDRVMGAHLDPGERIAFLIPFNAQTEAISMMG
jgi:hypothetical protein